eukprot:GFUD01019112.1.p1 GENE.GFUD01019112.1~~GFUD01019112.1.p1  ORF type:complete len:186 (-),score=45.81 GFUD01019112.1:112-669(-)
MQSLKQIASCFTKSPLSSIFSSHFKPLVISPFLRPFSVSTTCPIYLTQALEQKKAKKLPAHMYGGGENGGVDYGWEVMDQHRKGPHKKTRPNRNPLGFGIPFAKGIVIKPVIKKPKKPNSANRKCVLVKLSTGKELTAYVPGEGHNLQEHNVVLVRPGNLQDVPGVKTKCIRGRYDLPHVIKKAM